MLVVVVVASSCWTDVAVVVVGSGAVDAAVESSFFAFGAVASAVDAVADIGAVDFGTGFAVDKCSL